MSRANEQRSDRGWRFGFRAPELGPTQGHPSGVLWARWFLPDETPAQPETRVVKVGEVAKLTGR